MGATPFGYELARQFGLKIVETKPGLVRSSWPAKIAAVLRLGGRFGRSDRKANHHAFREKMLITHRA